MTEHEIRKIEVEAYLYSAEEPSQEQLERLRAFLERKYQKTVGVVWRKDESVHDGFRIEVGTSVYRWQLDQIYDWSAAGKSRQLKEQVAQAVRSHGDVMPLVRQTIRGFEPALHADEVGTVLTVGDGIATVSGLAGAEYGEILLFDGGLKGMILDLRESEIGCVIFGDDSEIMEGSMVRRTGKVAGTPVGEGFLGRVVNALGEPIDDAGEIAAEDYYPVEAPAPGIIDRQPVDQPLETGILTIDSMFPIGRGQRELIIGDRQTGKTAIALDTILNQKGKNIVCIYVAIGQKASSVAQLVETLRRRDAMDYTIVMAATASDSATLQYIAPYAGCALGEYFMRRGRDVLIVYDDLSKQAVAYRQISLLLRRPPGREAFPGDVFYLHSRLLERAARVNAEYVEAFTKGEVKGKTGSLTALPIIETQAGDVSAFVPTNVISITDGQIFLETNLFNAGIRPAVNPGISVSRVGGAAQTKIMKKLSGGIRTALAQYRELAAFSQFASDLDDATRKQLDHGQKVTELLKQKQYAPMSVAQQSLVLFAAERGYLADVELAKIGSFEAALLAYVDRDHAPLMQEINQSGGYNDEIEGKLKGILDSFKATQSW